MSTRVLITCLQMQADFPAHEARFADAGIQVDQPPIEQAMSEAELLAVIDHYDGVIAGDDAFTGTVLEHATRLRVLSKWGVGVDGIDRGAADRLGITVTNTPGAFDGEVADVCVGYLVLLARQLHRIDAEVRAGAWFKVAGESLGGQVLSIVGLGGIGRALARRAASMEMHVVGFDPDPTSCERARQDGVEVLDLPSALSGADFLSLNCPLTPTSRHLLDAESLALTRPGVRIVNTGRGPLIDEAALLTALLSGHVAGAALDVFEEEPLKAGHPLRDLPQVILGSHNASNTRQASARTSQRAVDNLFACLAQP